MDKRCEWHSELMNILSCVSTDLKWIKRGIFGAPLIIVMILVAFFSYIRGIDNRVTACETRQSMGQGNTK